ncbi:major facilitator superfamily domain-containing protein [Annulohypoxylon moriforme]|nr:major facilitator superfamily domain-containing protein [Annulohypoxylon moriforme]
MAHKFQKDDVDPVSTYMSSSSLLRPEPIPPSEETCCGTSISPYSGAITVVHFWTIFFVICLTLGIGYFDSTILASIHPVITSYFHSANSASWVSTAFILATAISQPITGRLSDALGRKPPFLFGLGLFAAATLWCAMAQSMISFILARAACGVGSGVAISLGSIMVSDLVPIEIRGNYHGYLNLVYGFSSGLGGSTGGIMVEALGWRWSFGVQVPILLICMFLAAAAIPNNIGKTKSLEDVSPIESMKTFDYVGALILAFALLFLISGLSCGGNIYPWSHPFIIAALLTTAVLIPAFIYHESRHPSPIIPLELTFRPPHLNLMLSNFCLTSVVNAVIFNVPLFFRAVLLESPSRTSFRMVVLLTPSSIAGAITGIMISRTGRLKWSLMLGSTMLLLGTIVITFGLRRGAPVWWSFLALLPISLGLGFAYPGSLMAILNVSTQQQQAVISSVLMLWRNTGVIIGVAMSSLLLQNSLIYFLDSCVDGPEKTLVIARVRVSLDAILELQQPYQDQVVDAYAKSLIVTFASTIILAFLMVAILAPLKLPRLGERCT